MTLAVVLLDGGFIAHDAPVECLFSVSWLSRLLHTPSYKRCVVAPPVSTTTSAGCAPPPSPTMDAHAEEQQLEEQLQEQEAALAELQEVCVRAME